MKLSDLKKLISKKEIKKIQKKIGSMSNEEATRELKNKLKEFNDIIQNEEKK